MNIRARGLAYLEHPFAVCNEELAAELTRIGWAALAQNEGLAAQQYSIANCVDKRVLVTGHRQRLASPGTEEVWLEFPDFQRLRPFYDEHGLVPMEAEALGPQLVLNKLESALALLNRAGGVGASVRKLVKSIQVLQQPHPEIDTSYSHPNIPFSIFVSVCADASAVSSLRVAESILHEAMHLQLTLLEHHVEMVRPASAALYYSPWRDEERPVRGVLHGMYVFRAVHDFYADLLVKQNCLLEARDFIVHRLEGIRNEFGSLLCFPEIPDLTDSGKRLATNLIQY